MIMPAFVEFSVVGKGKYQPIGKGGTCSPPAIPYRLQHQEAQKRSMGSGEKCTFRFLGTPVKFRKGTVSKRKKS